jgi:hypothetical protein
LRRTGHRQLSFVLADKRRLAAFGNTPPPERLTGITMLSRPLLVATARLRMGVIIHISLSCLDVRSRPYELVRPTN